MNTKCTASTNATVVNALAMNATDRKDLKIGTRVKSDPRYGIATGKIVGYGTEQGKFAYKVQWDHCPLREPALKFPHELTPLVGNAATVANASIFKKGEKVMSRMYGTRGIIQEVYGDDWYAVQYEGEKFPTKIQGYKLSHLPNIPNAASAAKNAPAVKNAKVEKQFGMVRVSKWDSGAIECSMGDMGIACPYGDKNRVIAETKKCIAIFKAKAADMERALAYIQTL